MVVSNISASGSQTSVAAKVTSVNTETASLGNVLPEGRQVRAQSEDPQNASVKLNAKELQELVGQANQATLVQSSNLKFTVAEGTDINVVRVEDSKTGELIRQIPSEQMIAIAKALKENSQGMMLQETV